MTRSITLSRLPNMYAITRQAPDRPFPLWSNGAGLVSLTRTKNELSIVCEQSRVPHSVQSSTDWIAFALEGSFGLDEPGIVLSVIQPLSENGIGVFMISTYDGDHLLIHHKDLTLSINLLTAAGHVVKDA